MLSPSAHRSPIALSRRRSGAAAVEFALISIWLFIIVMGTIEVGRALMVVELLNNAARSGARVGTLPGNYYTAVKTEVDDVLKNAKLDLPSREIDVKIDPRSPSGYQAANSDSAFKTLVAKDGGGQWVRVEVTIPLKDVTWLPTNWVMDSSTNLSSVATMRRE